MSWRVVARKDFEDAARSGWLLGLAALFVVLVSLGVYVTSLLSGGGGVDSTAVLRSGFVQDGVVTAFIPLVSLVVAYNAVVGERESGSLKLLLALPHSRADVVFGKVVGRAAAVATAIAAGFLLPAVVLLVLDSVTFAAVAYVQYTFFAALLGVAFVAIAVGFSAATASHRLAMAGAVGIYFLFVGLLGAIQFPLSLYLQVSGTPGWLPLSGQELIRMIRLINPTGAFKIVTNGFLGGRLFSGQGARLQAAAVVMLVAWTVVPPLFGLLRFEKADL
ncbi:MAG: ABC transporter permease subunit [Haloferacaceae archaeon]